MIDAATRKAYARDGAVMLPGLMAGWVETIRAGIARNMERPGPHAAENTRGGDTGRFFDDYVNWERIPEFRAAIFDGPLGAAAEGLLGGPVRLFHDHVLVKEPGTSKPTPWHQDAPYYFVEGPSVSFWIPVDPVTDASLRLVAGSHLWEPMVRPTRWLAEDDFYDTGEWREVPDPDAEGMRVLEWEMAPGDAVAFDFRTLHGARGNEGAGRRRAFSVRIVGADAAYVERPGPTSPPFEGHGMRAGDRLREDWFPVL